jgi:hypothetical protein
MKAVTFQGIKRVEVKEVPDPKIQKKDDIIVRLTSSAICGSDLHLIHDMIPNLPTGYIIGHEPMGVVEEAGPEVSKLKKGDRVLIPFNVACGECFYWKHDLTCMCDNSNPNGEGGGFFGYSDTFGGYPGGQAEYMRVPYGTSTPFRIPDDCEVEDEKLILLSDAMGTAYWSVENAGVKNGDTVVVTPVSLLGYEKVYRLDFPQDAVNISGGSNGNWGYSLSFMTESTELPFALISTSPKNNDVEASVNGAIFVSFNKAIIAGSNIENIKLKDGSGAEVAADVSINGNSLVIKPRYKLQYNMQYTVEIPEGAAISSTSPGSNSAYTFNFTTQKDNVAPAFIGCNIQDGSAGISVNPEIQVYLSEEVTQVMTIGKKGTLRIELVDNDGNIVNVSAAIYGSMISIRPSQQLINSTAYRLIIPSGMFTDGRGNYTEGYSIQFTTE